MDLTSDGHYKIDKPIHSVYGAGAVPAAIQSNVIARDRGVHPCFQTYILFNALPMSFANAGSGAGWATKPIYTFPAGYINLKGFNAYFTRVLMVSGFGDLAGSGDFGFGSTATADATIASTDVDMLASTAFLDPFVAGVGTSNVWARLAAAAEFNGSSTPISINFNAIIDDADVGDLSVTPAIAHFTGYARFNWEHLGDNETTI